MLDSDVLSFSLKSRAKGERLAQVVGDGLFRERLRREGSLTHQSQTWVSNTIIAPLPIRPVSENYVAVKLHTAQEISWRRQFCRHNFSDRFAPLGYDKRLASTGDFVQERETVGFEMSGRHGFGLLFHGHML